MKERGLEAAFKERAVRIRNQDEARHSLQASLSKGYVDSLIYI